MLKISATTISIDKEKQINYSNIEAQQCRRRVSSDKLQLHHRIIFIVTKTGKSKAIGTSKTKTYRLFYHVLTYARRQSFPFQQ